MKPSNSVKTVKFFVKNVLINFSLKQKKQVFATKSDFPIPISLQPNAVDLKYFKCDIMNISFKYQIFTLSVCKDIEICKF